MAFNTAPAPRCEAPCPVLHEQSPVCPACPTAPFPGLGNLQPWMQGLIAVAVFLVLVAIAFAVNHFWCQEEPEPVNTVMPVGNKADGILVGTDGKYSSMAASFRSSEHENAYENIPEEGRVRSTPM
ncbi:PDZK1-interacting protein 1 [Camelus ferus]|uniref:PDZK1-interacting protein 1 n=1 Tax=Camelus ferus TaxID=419612 RepID=A0A8B8U669_CAMFR|nr:PDZK1-interacting protein 1 [Camelus ferus]